MKMPGQYSTVPPSKRCSELILNLKPYVRQSGDQWRNPWFLKSRRLFDYLAVYIPEGRGIFSVGRKQDFPVKDGDLIWIPPDTLHEMRGTSEKMHCVFIHFDLSYDPRRSHWDAYIPGGTEDLRAYKEYMHPPFHDKVINSWKGKLKIMNHVTVGRLMKEICETHRRFGNFAAGMLSGMMLHLIELIYMGMGVDSRQNTFPHYTRMIEAMEYISGEINGPFNLGSVAKFAGMSGSHFRKIFRKTHGKSPREAHNEFRMRKACELMTYSSMNVSECANALGFSNIHNFSRAFKNFFSVSPLDYKQSGFKYPIHQ